MKKIILAFALGLSGGFALSAEPPKDPAKKPETKKVCKEVTKNGKKEQVCKTMKVHKKLENAKSTEKK